jgi:hypothetical protein
MGTVVGPVMPGVVRDEESGPASGEVQPRDGGPALQARILEQYLQRAEAELAGAARCARRCHREGTADVLTDYAAMVRRIRTGEL